MARETLEGLTQSLVRIKKLLSREEMHKRNQRYGPLLTPKDRTMTKGMYKMMDGIVRRQWRESEEQRHEAIRNMLLYGDGYEPPTGKLIAQIQDFK
jgi:hypothetical protein